VQKTKIKIKKVMPVGPISRRPLSLQYLVSHYQYACVHVTVFENVVATLSPTSILIPTCFQCRLVIQLGSIGIFAGFFLLKTCHFTHASWQEQLACMPMQGKKQARSRKTEARLQFLKQAEQIVLLIKSKSNKQANETTNNKQKYTQPYISCQLPNPKF